MSEYIPFPACATDAPIDISFVFEEEKPAGKRGFLGTEGDKFVFEDGTEARFWGANFNGGANFPEHDYAEKLAKRLAKMGQNMVRFHQLDAEWNSPNIFQYSKGKLLKNTRQLDSTSMDRLDYLVYCLKKEGIYVYMDLLTYRRFKEGDGVENALQLGDAAKPYCIYNRRMIELQKEFAAQFFEHVNPYTGLAYKDEPAIAMLEILNEGDLFSGWFTVEPYVTEFRTRFAEWLKEQNIEYDAENCNLRCMDEPLVQFKILLHDQYYKEMGDYLRSLGVKIPITGTNWMQHAALFMSNEKMDFTDGHSYFYDWRWGERANNKFCANLAITQADDCGFVKLLHMRSLDKPYFVSEWDMPWPNEYRAESPVLWAAAGALQGWSGFAIHTYSYLASQENMKILGKELTSDAVGGICYREGIYSTWNDPAKFGLFYHSALILRRGDVARANKRVAVQVDPYHAKERTVLGKVYKISAEAEYNAGNFDKMAPAYTCLVETSQVGTTVRERDDVDLLLTEPVTPVDLDKGEVFSDTGEMYRSWKKNYGWIDTAMTKCVYGFLQKNGEIALEDLSVTCKTDFAVIAMSSLTDEGLNHSDNIMLTTVGRARNKDAVFYDDQMIEWGSAPVEVEVICAEIRLKTSRPNLKVWSVTPEGLYQGQIPAVYENGELVFTVGEHWRSMYYLIQAE